jgi:hypothetical protein
VGSDLVTVWSVGVASGAVGDGAMSVGADTDPIVCAVGDGVVSVGEDTEGAVVKSVLLGAGWLATVEALF